MELSEKVKSEQPKKTNLREWVSYPQHLSPWAKSLLDEIAELIDEPKTSDRYSKMSDFLEEAKNKGIIKESEYSKLRNESAKQM